MARLSKYPLTADVWEVISDDYYDLVAALTEKIMFIKRFAIALLLSEDFKYDEIVKTLKVSPTTIFFVQNSVNRGKYLGKVIEKLKSKRNVQMFFENVEKTLLALLPPSKIMTRKARARFLNPDFVDFKEQNDWDRKRKILVWETTSRTRNSLQ
ncbi:MAG: hypothetical protein Q7S14_00495 [bacterium]|nr:hypothetical protein [bacterium]